MDTIFSIIKGRLKIKHHRPRPGSAPGTLVQYADAVNEPVEISIISFSEKDLEKKIVQNVDEIVPMLAKYPMNWINVFGLGDVNVLSEIAKILNLNSLAMEDVLSVPQRPKVEEYDDIAFAIMSEPEITNDTLSLQQVSMFWGKNFILTIQERRGDCFIPLIARLKHGDRRQRMLSSEYMAYSMLDAVIDNFFPILELYGNQLDEIEEKAIDNASTAVIHHIHNFKHNLHLLRRAVWAQREAMGNFKDVASRYSDNIRFFIRDCEDHTIQLIDIVESYRERTASLMDIYLASVSNRTNRIVKVLTIMTAIFMPVGVLASIYGMNFDRSKHANMPELSWAYGYVFFWLMAILITGGMLLLFWRKGWFED